MPNQLVRAKSSDLSIVSEYSGHSLHWFGKSLLHAMSLLITQPTKRERPCSIASATWNDYTLHGIELFSEEQGMALCPRSDPRNAATIVAGALMVGSLNSGNAESV